jgi:cytoskeletal protein CcmA (bactofilin family)
VAVIAGGQTRLQVNNDGNIGIGTTTPTQKLDIIGSVNVTSNLIIAGTMTAANANVTGTMTAGNVNITGNVTGNLTIAGTMTAANANVTGTMTAGNVNITGNVTGNLTIAGTMTAANSNITGTVAMGSSFKRNRIINGNMLIDQRNAGASVTPTVDNQYVLDRWRADLSVSSKYSVQQNAGSVTPTAGFPNYLGVTSLSAYTVSSTDYFMMEQPIEGYNMSDFAWGTASAKSITISFWVRSSLTGTFGGSLMNASANRSYPFTYTISAATTWEQKSVTIAGDTSGTWGSTNGIGIRLFFGLGVGTSQSGTAGAWAAAAYLGATGATSVVGTNGATFYITGVQLEVGTKATPYEMQIYSDQLAQCQRYYTTYTVSFRGYCLNGDFFSNPIYYSTQMRTVPTAARSGGTFTSCNAIGIENITIGMSRYTVQATSSTMVQIISDVATFSAEL